jgi:hypothetical protein
MDNITIIEDKSAPLLVGLGDGHYAWKDPDSGRMFPHVAGAQDVTAHPLGPPVISGNEFTVDFMLQNPTRVTRFLMDITLQRFFADLLFSAPGGVTGGAVIFDTLSENELYLDRDVERIAPGAEAPLVTSSRRAPGVAEVEKWGGKFFTTYESRDRNETVLFRNKSIQLGNTIVRKNNQRAVATIEAAIASTGGATTVPGTDWSAAVPNGSNPSPPIDTPAADFAGIQLLNEQRELGLVLDTVALNPVQAMELTLFYGAGNLSQVLRDNGITTLFSTNRIAPGTAYVFARNQVGQQRVEAPLRTRNWDEEKTERTWTQSTVRNLMFVDNPWAVYKLTGL